MIFVAILCITCGLIIFVASGIQFYGRVVAKIDGLAPTELEAGFVMGAVLTNLVGRHRRRRQVHVESAPNTLVLAEPEVSDLLEVNYSNMSLIQLYEIPATLGFSCRNNRLARLPKLPPSLIILNCSENELMELPNLPPSLEFLYCSNNELTVLPELPPKMAVLICKNNLLTRLPDLPSTLMLLECSGNDMPYDFQDSDPIEEKIIIVNRWNAGLPPA